ncbi:MAG: glycoside hydrolase family 16 protein [Flavobacterium sp.]|nr:glycoside hydrolase family 16 protein [Pedobacter sp.]
MKNIKLLSKAFTGCSLSVLLFLTACKKEVSPSSSKVFSVKSNSSKNITKTSAVTYQLQWSDEFNGTSVNTADWNFEIGGGGWGNNEKQYYKAENATVSGGFLVITAKKERVKANNYTSARLNTKAKREFTYGKIEARMKLPMVQGLWPAFWMLGSNISTVGWPACGEIDIMEHINTSQDVLGTAHWNGPNGYVYNSVSKATTPSDFHIYSIEWSATAINWFIDGVLFHSLDITNNVNSTEEFQKPFYILLNLAVGGNLPGQTIDDTKLPASVSVDYVRVYNAI